MGMTFRHPLDIVFILFLSPVRVVNYSMLVRIKPGTSECYPAYSVFIKKLSAFSPCPFHCIYGFSCFV